ncbi:exonuclease domain-containing protein [Roseibium alexandrii]|uniref:3'-5' exonuclease n=1 Tax=Roseibium alexandrii TaxID=388408 RepID=UPI0037536E81
MRVITCFDLETTGLPRDMQIDDPNYPRMVQLGGVTWSSDGKVHGRIQNYVRQEDKRTSKAAEKIHGITDRISGTRGIPEAVAIGWITNSLRYSTDVVGWSLDFDLSIVQAALIRFGKNPNEIIRPGIQRHDLKEIMTPMVGKTNEDGSQRWPTLGEGYEWTFGKPLYEDGALHDAVRDSEACREIFMELWTRGVLHDLERLVA